MYRRFQITFNTEVTALAFIESIQLVCPFTVNRNSQSQASQTAPSAPRTQATASSLARLSTNAQNQRTGPSTSGATSSLRFSSTLPRSATTYRKNTMFDDPLSSSSFGEHASSQSSGTSTTRSPLDAAAAIPSVSSRPSVVQRANLHPEAIVISSSPSSDRDIDMHPSPLASAGPALGYSNNVHYPSMPSFLAHQTQLPSQSAQTPGNGASRKSEASMPVQGDPARPEQGRRYDTTSTAMQVGDLSGGRAGGISDGLLDALRQGEPDLYNMSLDELRQVVAEVIREPRFPELVSSHISPTGKSGMMFVPAPMWRR